MRRATPSAGGTTAGHPRVGLACLARCHALFMAQLAFELCGLLGFVKSSSRFMVTLAITLRICPVALARPQTRQKLLLAPSTPCASLRPIRPPVDGLQAFSAQYHHLVD